MAIAIDWYVTRLNQDFANHRRIFANRFLVIHTSTGALFLATRSALERKCLGALYVRVRDWVVPTVKKMLLRDDLHSEPPAGN